MIILGIFKRKEKKEKINKKAMSFNEWPDHVVTLDGKKFDDFIQKYPLSLIDFWAPWCKPCKNMSPRLRRLSRVYKDKVAFGKLNIQQNNDIAKKYKILGIPHLIIFSYGKEIGSINGVRSIGYVKDTIDDILKKV